MNRKKKENYRYILLFLGLWFLWFQNVSASQMLFPFFRTSAGKSAENRKKHIKKTGEKK